MMGLCSKLFQNHFSEVCTGKTPLIIATLETHSSPPTGSPHNLCAIHCNFIVNVLDLPFASPIAKLLLNMYFNNN